MNHADRPNTRLDDDDDDIRREGGYVFLAIRGYQRLYGNRVLLTAQRNWSIPRILIWFPFALARIYAMATCFIVGNLFAVAWFKLPRLIRWPIITVTFGMVAVLAYGHSWFFLLLSVMPTLIRVPSLVAGDLRVPEAHFLLSSLKGYVLATAVTYPYTEIFIIRIVAIVMAMRCVNLVFYHAFEGVATGEMYIAQKRRDRQAESILNAIKKLDRVGTSVSPFVLYLRPFSVTAKQTTSRYFDAVAARDGTPTFNPRGEPTTHPLSSGIINESYSVYEYNSDAESEWERAVASDGAFVALGRPVEAFGAGRIHTTEENWTDDLRLLGRHAKKCVVVPSARFGTQWEIRWVVAEGLLPKCCFYMPPRTRGFDCAQDWTAAKEAVADVLELPDYDARGMLLSYDGQFVRREICLNATAAIPIWRDIRDCLQQLSKIAAPMQ